MSSEEKTTTTTTAETEKQAVPCFVRHEDAGDLCMEPQAVRVYGLGFCATHGEEVRIGALLEEHQDAAYFFERSRNPHVPSVNDLVDRELENTERRLQGEAPSDEDYYSALLAAYPEVPEAVRSRVVMWQRDEEPLGHAVVDFLLNSLETVHKLMRLAHADGETWLVELLEEERESVAAQAAYALRNPEPPELEDKGEEK